MNKMKVICCQYLGCRWYGLESDQKKHEFDCKYANSSGDDLINLLENTNFDYQFNPIVPNYSEKIIHNILPLFTSEKLAAIDFEIKDVKNMLTHGQLQQMNIMSKCSNHQHPDHSIINLATQSQINEINMLFGLVEMLVIGQKPTNETYPWGYENSWVIYESGTATTLGETISVKVTAHIHVGYEISLSYCINFHGNIKGEFLLGHFGGC